MINRFVSPYSFRSINLMIQSILTSWIIALPATFQLLGCNLLVKFRRRKITRPVGTTTYLTDRTVYALSGIETMTGIVIMTEIETETTREIMTETVEEDGIETEIEKGTDIA